MYITGLVAKNCYSFDEVTINFDEFPVTQIIGNNLDEKRISDEDSNSFHSNANGVGKTNIYNLIIQALYSRDIYKTKKAFLSNLYSKEKFSILLYLTINEDLYKVQYNNSECLLYKNTELYLEGRQKVTEFFENLVPFEMFLRLTYLSSKVYFPFFESTNKEQQEFLSLLFKDLLTLKKKLPKIKEERQRLQTHITNLEKEVHHLEQQKSQKYEVEKDLPEKFEICDQTNEINELSREKGKLEQQQVKYNELQNELKSIKVEDIKFDEARLLAQYSEGRKVKDRLDEITSTLKQLNEIRNVTYCPTCFQELSAESINNQVKSLEEEEEILKPKLLFCQSEYRALNRQKKEKEQNEKNKQKLQEIKKQLNKYNEEEIKKELNQVTQYIKSLKETQRLEEEKLNKYRALETEIKLFNEQQKVIKSQIQRANKQLSITKNELTEAKKSVQMLLTLEEVCNKVVVAKQIPNRLKILESFINEELANYTSQYSVNLGMKNDKIIKEITKEGKTYPVENLSTGEKTRLNIALLFAVRHILAALQKEVYNINLVFFDEIFSALDTSGRNILIDTIKDYGLNQFIISHSYVNPDYPVLELVRKNNKTRLKE